MLGGKLYQRQQSGIQLQPSVIPRKAGSYEGGAGLGLWHCVILWATPAGHMERGARCPRELPGPCLCPARAKEWGHSTGMSNTLSEGAEVAGFILIWKCGPCCLLWCASPSCLWQLWEYWFWQTAAKSSRLEGVSNKCDKRGKLLMPGGRVQGPADYQKPFRSCEEEDVSSDTGMGEQIMISPLPLPLNCPTPHVRCPTGWRRRKLQRRVEFKSNARESFLSIWNLAKLIIFDKKHWVLATSKTQGSVGVEDVQTEG